MRLFILAVMLLTAASVRAEKPGFVEGKPPPKLVAYDEAGQMVSLARLFKATPRPKAVVVQFWASWCKSCLVELDELIAHQEQLARGGTAVLLVNVSDTASAASAALAKRPVTGFVSVRDETGGLVETLGLAAEQSSGDARIALPLSVVVRGDPPVVGRILRGGETDFWTALTAALR